MRPFLTSAETNALFSSLPDLRRSFGSAGTSAEGRVEAALGLVACYGRLHLFDRAIDWLEAVSPLPEGELNPALVRRFFLAAAAAWLDREEPVAAGRFLDKLRVGELSLDEERAFLAAQVRLSLLAGATDSFAPLERAFRHLRHHPDGRWSARFLLWRSQWLTGQGRPEESQGALKKSLAEAQAAGAIDLQLQGWLSLASLPGLGKTKAIRAGRMALDQARLWQIPAAEAEAQRLLSRLTVGPRETESALLFQGFSTTETTLAHEATHGDRLCRDEDRKVLDAAGQERRLREGELLATIVGRLAFHSDLARSLDDLYPPLRSLMAADVFGIALWVAEQRVLDYALFLEEGLRTRVGLIPVDSSRSLGAWCFREKKAVRINDIDQEYGAYLKELSRLTDHRPKSMLFHPLVAEGEPLGIITVQSFSRNAYDAEAASQLAVIAACVALRLQTSSRSPL